MGIFDWLRKPKQPADESPPLPPALPSLCYDVAYFILPDYAFENLDRIVELCDKTPTTAGQHFYLLACIARTVEPDMEAARKFQWHRGNLTGDLEYLVLEFPTPPPLFFDMTKITDTQAYSTLGKITLAPYFCAVIRSPGSKIANYYILGQALDGGTILRGVTSNGFNANLGPGPDPKLDLFIAHLKTFPFDTVETELRTREPLH